MSNAKMTDMICTDCESSVWIEDGDYSCECNSIAIFYITEMGEDFPKSWVDKYTHQPSEASKP